MVTAWGRFSDFTLLPLGRTVTGSLERSRDSSLTQALLR
jgi:hypothetical protein